MLFEYAVEPQAIGSSWQNFRYLIEKFGFDRGRLISRLPNKWEKKVIQSAKEAGVPDIRLASIIERLRQSKMQVADFGRTYDSDKSWIDNALTEHARAPFHAIVALAGTEGNAAVLPLADLDEQHALFISTQDRAVARDARAIADALSGLLRVSSRILFVDPFFDPFNARYKNTLRECLGVVAAHNPAAVCEIHYRFHHNKPANSDLEANIGRMLAGMIPANMTIAFYCWKEKEGGADFHARYLLTEHGGIGVDAGFSAEGGHQESDMHLMSLLLSQARLKMFARDSNDFDLVEPVLEIASNGTVRRI
jgi:hypothetical protein